jgi:hypothetical protein
MKGFKSLLVTVTGVGPSARALRHWSTAVRLLAIVGSNPTEGMEVCLL